MAAITKLQKSRTEILDLNSKFVQFLELCQKRQFLASHIVVGLQTENIQLHAKQIALR